jgi:hypothetical protein
MPAHHIEIVLDDGGEGEVRENVHDREKVLKY